jgi:prepilin-type N-terminal cleavage/methylation domain-containing protein
VQEGLRSRLAAERGFTLIELLIVAVVIGILTMIAMPSYLSLQGRAMDSTNKANVRSILTPIASFYADHQTYTGMTLAGLTTYDRALDTSKYTLGAVTATTYCIQSPQGTGAHVFRKNGPAALFEKNHC